MTSTWSGSASYTKVEQVSESACRDLVELVKEVQPFSSDSNVLDLGCGTGMLSKAIKNKARDVKLTAGDLSPGMVEAVEKLAAQHSWPNTTLTTLDAFNLSPPLSPNTFTHALSAFCICLLPNNLSDAIKQMHHILRPNSLLALANWGDSRYAWGPKYYPVFTRAVRRLTGDESYETPVLMNSTWCDADALKKELEDMGWRDVQVEKRECPSRWRDAEEVESWLLEGGNPVVWEKLLQPFEKGFGRSRWDLRGILKEEVEKLCGREEVELMVPVISVVARK